MFVYGNIIQDTEVDPGTTEGGDPEDPGCNTAGEVDVDLDDNQQQEIRNP